VTDLPEIPAEAYEAATAGAYSGGADEMLAAAWPHLYAAALRHAADEVPFMAADFDATDWLRRMADEADHLVEVEGRGEA
jgi:hypothetical protein